MDKKIVLATDHAGFELKEACKEHVIRIKDRNKRFWSYYSMILKMIIPILFYQQLKYIADNECL